MALQVLPPQAVRWPSSVPAVLWMEDVVSADLLREAAEAMRVAWEGDENADPAEAEFYVAIAEWLEVVAERQKPLERYNRRSHGWTGSRQANAVARAYLGRDA